MAHRLIFCGEAFVRRLLRGGGLPLPLIRFGNTVAPSDPKSSAAVAPAPGPETTPAPNTPLTVEAKAQRQLHHALTAHDSRLPSMLAELSNFLNAQPATRATLSHLSYFEATLEMRGSEAFVEMQVHNLRKAYVQMEVVIRAAPSRMLVSLAEKMELALLVRDDEDATWKVVTRPAAYHSEFRSTFANSVL